MLVLGVGSATSETADVPLPASSCGMIVMFPRLGQGQPCGARAAADPDPCAGIRKPFTVRVRVSVRVGDGFVAEPEPEPHQALQYGVRPHDLVVLRERVLAQVCTHAQAVISRM